MNTLHIRPRFHHKIHLLILRRLVIFANIFGLSTYIFLRMIFYDLPFVLQEELVLLLNVAGWATGIAVAISFIIFAVDGLIYMIRQRKQFKFLGMVQVPEPQINKNSGA
ncbi:MAG: hypothetical protein ABIO79_16725 [Ferruginibacter sp.]